jgi:uncharacterized protein (UPF0332 family)
MSELDKCIERGSLKRLDAAGTDAVEIELRAACEDLADAEFVHEHRMHKRTTITAYYAMFHAARALVLARGYVEKSHYCLLVAFRAFYGTEGEGRELARGIERARVLRENADYNAEFGEESAEAALEVARRFVRFATEVTNQGL